MRDSVPRLGIVVASLVCMLALPSWARARDEILSWDVTLEVGREGRIRGTERIRLRSSDGELADGLVRVFPTSRWRPGGIGWIEIPFELRAAEMDGRPADHRERAVGGEFGESGVRIRVGPSLRTAPGAHAYELVWETERRVAFGAMNDTLEWESPDLGANVVIRSASIRVRVPDLAAPEELTARVGRRGEAGEPAEIAWDPVGGATARASRSLEPGESLSLRMVLPKWVIRVPTYHTERGWFWLDWWGWIEAAWAVAGVVVLYLLMWFRVGRDRRGSGPLVVRYEPPRGLSPAALGYVFRRGYDANLYAAALVGLATKGWLRILRSGATWRVHRSSSTVPLTSDERAVHEALLGNTDALTLDSSNAHRLAAGARALQRALSVQLERAFFVANRRWWMAGLVTSVVVIAVLAWRWRFDIHVGAWFVVIFLAGWTFVTASLLIRALGYLRHGRAGGGRAALVQGSILSLATLPIAAANLGLAVAVLEMVPTHLVVAGVTNAAFYHLLERPTVGGRRILDRVEGFHHFLATVDGDRLARPGDETGPELYEKYLPHAIALGVEKRWASRFRALLTPPAPAGGGAGPRRNWYAAEGERDDVEEAAAALGIELPRALERGG